MRITRIRTKKCPNQECGRIFDDRENQIVYTPNLKCFSCADCGAVLSYKRCVFGLDLSESNEMRALLNTFRKIKTLALYQKWVESLKQLYADHPELPRTFGSVCFDDIIDDSIPLENKLPSCTLFDNLNREYRLRSHRVAAKSSDSADNVLTTCIKEMDKVNFFGLLKKYKMIVNPTQFIRDKIAGDEGYLQKIYNTLDLKICDTVIGHYSGTSGNAAKKASTRVWQALRFLELCNSILQEMYPDTQQKLMLTYNNSGGDILDLIKLEGSRVNVQNQLNNALAARSEKANGISLDRYFRIKIVRKESRYNTPKFLKQKKARLFLNDFSDNVVTSKAFSKKTFNYIVFMNLQNADKMEKMMINRESALAKMGPNIWLANVYALDNKKVGAVSA